MKDEIPANVTVRQAKCTSCNKKLDSRPDLPFFEFRGEGSRLAKCQCKNCNYHGVAHTPEVMARNTLLKCTNFEPHGAFEEDSFYCGCRGWD